MQYWICQNKDNKDKKKVTEQHCNELLYCSAAEMLWPTNTVLQMWETMFV